MPLGNYTIATVTHKKTESIRSLLRLLLGIIHSLVRNYISMTGVSYRNVLEDLEQCKDRDQPGRVSPNMI